MSEVQRAKWPKFPIPEKPKKSTELKGQKGYMVDVANNYITANSNITDRQLKQGGCASTPPSTRRRWPT